MKALTVLSSNLCSSGHSFLTGMHSKEPFTTLMTDGQIDKAISVLSKEIKYLVVIISDFETKKAIIRQFTNGKEEPFAELTAMHYGVFN